MVNTMLLDRKIAESGKTKTFLSEKMGMTIQTFKKKCTNKTDFFLSEVDILCTELGVKTLTEKDQIFFAKQVDKMTTERNE